MVAGPGLHWAGTVRVACRKGFGHRGGGLPTGIICPAQCELQCGSLRKRLKWWQSLWSHKKFSLTKQDVTKDLETAYLPIKNGFPCSSLLAHRAVLHPLH